MIILLTLIVSILTGIFLTIFGNDKGTILGWNIINISGILILIFAIIILIIN